MNNNTFRNIIIGSALMWAIYGVEMAVIGFIVWYAMHSTFENKGADDGV